jgi:hypothetical protein
MNLAQEAQAQRYSILRDELAVELRIHLHGDRDHSAARDIARLLAYDCYPRLRDANDPPRSPAQVGDRLRAIARALELVATMGPAVPPVEGSPANG